MKQHVEDMPKKMGTRTDLALNLIATKLFTPEGGDRPEAKNVLLVFTDGLPGGWDKTPVLPFPQLTKLLEVIKSHSVKWLQLKL